MLKKRNAANELKKKFAEIGDLPKELITTSSRMVLMGNSEFTIENYSGIIEYEPDKIRIKIKTGEVCIKGEDLSINDFDNQDLFIRGKIRSIEIDE